MDACSFSLEFRLNRGEVRRLNKMYFKSLYRERFRILFECGLFYSICCDFFDFDNDLIAWIVRNLTFVIIFFLFQHSCVNFVCKCIFQLINKFLIFDFFLAQYRFNFTNSFIYVHSPLGEFAHKWAAIEKVILTKDFLFLCFKNEYIISIFHKNHGENITELMAFIEDNVIHIKYI